MATQVQRDVQRQVTNPQALLRILIPLYALLAYVTFLIAGYSTLPFVGGQASNYARALPLFAFLGLLLITLEAVTSQGHSLRAFFFYLLPVSVFVLIFSAEAILFGGNNQQFIHNPAIYEALNILTLPAYVVGVRTRRRHLARRSYQSSASATGDTRSGDATPYTTLASYAAGLALLGFINWGLLVLVKSLIKVGSDTSGLHLPSIDDFGLIDRDVGLVAAFIALVLMVIAGLILGIGAGQGGSLSFWRSLRLAFGDAVIDGGLSLKYVLTPILALVPGLSIAVFSKQLTQSLVNASHITTNQASPWDVFNPFSSEILQDYPTALLALLLGVVAVVATIGAVAVLEIDRDPSILPDTVRAILDAGRAVGLVLALFLLSLATLNVLLLVTNGRQNRPFQLGAMSVVGLLTAVVLFGTAQVRARPPNT